MSMVETDAAVRERREAAEERERRIAQLTRKDIKERDRAAQKRERSLEDALAEPELISARDLRSLVRTYEAPVISLYLDFAPLGAPRAPLRTLFHSVRHVETEARSRFIEQLPRRARQILDLDLREIELFLENLEPDRGRGLVLFKSGEELSRVTIVPTRTPDRMVIDPDPFIEPLEAILDAQHRALIVWVEKDRAEFRVHFLGRQHDIASLDSFVPADRVDRSRPGAAQRHRLTHEHWHLREVLRRTSDLIAEHECDTLIVAGSEPITDVLAEMLPKQLRGMLIGTLRPEPRWTRRRWETAADTVLAELRRTEEEAALEELPFLQSRGRVAAGLAATLDALNVFLARDLYVSDSLEQRGFICREHHFLALQDGACPFDDTPLLEVEDVVDEAIEVARTHGVGTLVVEQRGDLLEPYTGIAAVTYAVEAATGPPQT